MHANSSEPAKAEVDWEYYWAPYDPPTYEAVLGKIHSQDVVLEIGAGDLRLANKIAQVASRVYAVEIDPIIMNQGLESCNPLPRNLIPIRADALSLDFPRDIDVGVLLMRHCTHFTVYADKLQDIGCRSLVTNARWRMDVEEVFLQQQRMPFEMIEIGWYACWCGAVGFKPGPVGMLTEEALSFVHEVSACPGCYGTADPPRYCI